jgi:hypothetical protein
MEEPTFTDYVTLIFNLFERFVKNAALKWIGIQTATTMSTRH